MIGWPRRTWEVCVLDADGQPLRPPPGMTLPAFVFRWRAVLLARDCNNYATSCGYSFRYAVRRRPYHQGAPPMSDQQQPVPAIPGPRRPSE